MNVTQLSLELQIMMYIDVLYSRAPHVSQTKHAGQYHQFNFFAVSTVFYRWSFSTMDKVLNNLRSIQTRCDCGIGENRRLSYQSAHEIYLLAGEVAGQLQLQLPAIQEPPRGGFQPEDYAPLVCAEAEGLIRLIRQYEEQLGKLPFLRTGAVTEEVGKLTKQLDNIRSAMSEVMRLCPENSDVNSSQMHSETRETTASNQSAASMKVAVKLMHWLQGRGYPRKDKEFDRLPDFLDLHDLGEALLCELNSMVVDFDLTLDGTILQNENTKQVLKRLKGEGSRGVCIFLVLKGDQLVSIPADKATKILVCIDGNIGSRKSDFMKKLLEINEKSGHQQVRVIREPLKELESDLTEFWNAVEAGEDASDEQRAQSSRFEETMFDHHYQVATNPDLRRTHLISERSMEAKVHVFNELTFKKGKLLKESRDEMQRKFHVNIRGQKCYQPHAVVFFEISVQKAHERIKERNRPGEEYITQDYLTDIEAKYAALYPSSAANVIRLDSDQPMEDLLVAVQSELPKLLKKQQCASDEEIDSFTQFFQDVRSEPSN